ncbi:sugar ABC transporter substrate-binding protein [Quadrisphaera oryzae]|uniref:sugar ABC transporter substrate-binding protein n=1 Tax=Quadrisphaera TaxID=317661 RepID=UPI001647F752|nr:sugar ABC transporter substrate-binding protein [Quadrisphaera sp. RL12-1S]
MARRRVLTTALAAGAAVLLPLTLAACGGSASNSGSSGSGSGGATSLTLQDYYTDDPGKTVWEGIYKSCADAAGVTVTPVHIAGKDLIPKVLQQAQSKTLPDVLMLDNPDLQQIASSGALADLSQFGVSSDGYADGIVKASTYEGKLYGLQPTTNSIALFYNKKMFADAGIANPPQTWDELQADAKALTKDGKYGLALSAINTYEGTWQFLPFFWSAGGDEKDINTPQAAQALQLWVDMFKDGSISKSAVNWTQADVKDQFAAGNAAMMVNGPWQFPSLATSGVDYAVAPIPPPTAGGKTVSPLGGETWTVPETGNKDKQAKAAEIVKCINSDANQKLIADKNNTVPTKTALAEQYASSDSPIAGFAKLVPDLRARTGELGDKWPDAATKIYTAVQNAVVNGQAPSAALAAAQNG